MNDADATPRLVECSNCGNLGIGSGDIRCCDRSMVPVTHASVLGEPTLEAVLETVFDVSETELEICLCVMEAEGVTVSELADQIDYDRSVVARHLAHLAELGIVERRRRVLEQGGHVYVYTPVSEAQVRERFSRAFVDWMRDAFDQIRSLQREKVESIAEAEEVPAWRIIREG